MIDVYISLLFATQLAKNASSSVLALHLTWSVERGTMQYRQTLVTCTFIGCLCSGAQVSLIILLDRNVRPTAMYIQWHLVEMVLQIMSATGAFSLVFYSARLCGAHRNSNSDSDDCAVANDAQKILVQNYKRG
jgi:hypothetical protein